MRRAVCPGSFDPVTNGHLDIIGRASELYDDVVVAVGANETKPPLFTVDERLDMIRQVTTEFPNVRADSFRGLIVDYCCAERIPVIVKGLRAVSDFDYEMQMAQMNTELSGVETLSLLNLPQDLTEVIYVVSQPRNGRRLLHCCHGRDCSGLGSRNAGRKSGARFRRALRRHSSCVGLCVRTIFR